jgi:tripartite-type tricarboxylate transporter receptor subunit TctC
MKNIFLSLIFILFSSTAGAQAFPAKPVRIVVGYPPGGSGDFTTRVIADEMQKNLGVSVVTENKPGAGGNLAAEAVAKSPADGYTLLNAWHHSINLVLYKNPGYSHKDFIPITKIATGPTIVVVNNNLPVNSLKELIGYAKANPDKLFIASAGFGSTPNISATLFQAATGLQNIPQVQFKGGGPAMQSVLAGDTQVAFSTAPTVMGMIRAGRLRALAVTTRKGSPSVPGIPGTEEAGVPGFESTFWFGLYAPAGTPRAIVMRLHEAAVKGLAKPEVREKIAVQGMDATPNASPEEFDAEIRAEGPALERLLRESNARVE